MKNNLELIAEFRALKSQGGVEADGLEMARCIAIDLFKFDRVLVETARCFASDKDVANAVISIVAEPLVPGLVGHNPLVWPSLCFLALRSCQNLDEVRQAEAAYDLEVLRQEGTSPRRSKPRVLNSWINAIGERSFDEEDYASEYIQGIKSKGRSK